VNAPRKVDWLRVSGALLLCFLFTAGIHQVRAGSGAAPDYPCLQAGEEVVVHINAGDSGSKIAQNLFVSGVVKSAESYFRVAVGDERSQRVAPGDHRLTKFNCARNVLNQLLDSQRIAGLISVQEGMWVSEVLPQMYSAGFTKSEVAQALAKVKRPQGFTVTEGLLFPAQYSFDKSVTAEAALNSMISRAEREMKSAGFYSASSKFDPQKLLIIASLIQAEGSENDFGRVSRVIYNRLAKGMPLQFDSTVHYVKKLRGNIFLSTQSTLIRSPYNTYQRYGLPPGPINNPGAKAMRAALNPEVGSWVYFITVAPGDTRFTDNLGEFNQWKVEYKKNLRAGKFKGDQ
jgi:UPF0755 protein